MMKIELNETTTNDAFATFENRRVKLHVAITGPVDVTRTRFESATTPHFDISILPSAGVSATTESAIASQITRVLKEVVDLKEYARKQITITVQIVDQVKDSWSVQVVDIANCIYLACITAGIKLNVSFWGVCIYLDSNGKIVNGDSNNESIKSAHRVIYSIKNAVLDQLIFLDSNGEFEREDVWRILEKSGEMVESEMDKVRAIIGENIGSQFIFK